MSLCHPRLLADVCLSRLTRFDTATQLGIKARTELLCPDVNSIGFKVKSADGCDKRMFKLAQSVNSIFHSCSAGLRKWQSLPALRLICLGVGRKLAATRGHGTGDPGALPHLRSKVHLGAFSEAYRFCRG